MGGRGSGHPAGLSSSEHVYRELRAAIVSGELPGDSRLVEHDIGERYGVSRTPVREALRRLLTEDLVLRDPSRGVIVRTPDAREIEGVLVVREALDALAASLAAVRITPAQLARLGVIVEAMEQATAAVRRESLITANVRFHEAIYAAAGNRMLDRLARDLEDFVGRFTSLPAASDARLEAALREHQAILAALEAHDPDAAGRAAREHLALAREYLIRAQALDFAQAGLA